MKFFTAYKKIFVLLLFPLIFFLCSCESVREYVKSQQQLYEDDVLVSETNILTLDGKVQESSSKSFFDLQDVCKNVEDNSYETKVHGFTAVREKKEKNGKVISDEITFTLIENTVNKKTLKTDSYVVGEKHAKLENDEVVFVSESGWASDSWQEELFNENLNNLVVAVVSPNVDDNAKPARSSESRAYSEKVTVKSVPNGNYIFYQIAGKPFVILGASIINVLKCGGYAFVNLLGGYNFATGNEESLWLLPSYSKSKEAAAKAKEENRIKYYPEYHLPFTNNHITVEKFDRDISAMAMSQENAEVITPVEIYEFDNTMSVTRSAASDAASTAGVAGLIGTAVTIPVSVGTWICGVALGIYSKKEK